jgi:hypothetical protein
LAATIRIVGLFVEEPAVDDRLARADLRGDSKGLATGRGKAADFA